MRARFKVALGAAIATAIAAIGMQPASAQDHGQGGPPPADARDPDYSEGTRHSPVGGMDMADHEHFGYVLIDRLQVVTGDEHGQDVEGEAWYGGDYNKLWLKGEAERRDGETGWQAEVLWDRAFAPFWSTQLGVRHDGGEGPDRTWLAAGVQGLSPYWFETEATAYWRGGGHFALSVDVSYDILLTQRLILDPSLAANLYSKDDESHGIGAGLSDLEAGLRLRYEFGRKFAPYVGVKWQRKFGGTADMARQRGEETSGAVAEFGVRIWF